MQQPGSLVASHRLFSPGSTQTWVPETWTKIPTNKEELLATNVDGKQRGGPVGDRVRSTSWWVNSHGRRRRGSPSESSVVVPRQDPEFPEKRSFHGIGMSQFIHMRFQGVQWFTAERKRESTSSKLPSCMELCSQCPSPRETPPLRSTAFTKSCLSHPKSYSNSLQSQHEFSKAEIRPGMPTCSWLRLRQTVTCFCVFTLLPTIMEVKNGSLQL